MVRRADREMEMRYDAFISYRHAPLDMEIAKKVHTGLETYRIPGAVQKKTGKKKMGRVFRDQEELPIGSDLDDNISGALKESKYLIVICSPRTPESYWVCKEIETFIEMHDRNHILAVLIEGEPDESFPSLLLSDENGNPVEPLAADVRGGSRRERNAKFRTEILRLVAPVIGCTYDDLKQRHRERMIKRTISIVSSAAAVIAAAGTAFGIYNANVAARMKQLADEKAALADEKAALADEKTRLAEEITVQYHGKQENQSRFFAEESLTLLKAGNREDAVLVAMEGLPSEDNERPYVADAEYALSRALYAYDDGSTMTFDRILSQDLSVSEMYCTEDKSKVVTIDAGSKVYVWDVSDWSLKLGISPAVDKTDYYVKVNSADADDTGVYIATDNELTKYDYEGNIVYSRSFDDTIKRIEVCDNDGTVVAVCMESISVLNASDGEIKSSIANTTEHPYTGRGRYNPDIKKLIVPHYDPDADRTYITVFDPYDGEQTDILLSEGYYMDGCVTPDGNIAVISCNNDLLEAGVTRVVADLMTSGGEHIWTRELDVHIKYTMTFDSLIKAHKYETEDGESSDIVIAVEAEAFTIDEKSGQLKAAFTLPGDATALSLVKSSPYGRMGYRQGNIDFIDFAQGRIYSEYTIDTEDSIRDWLVIDDKLVFASYQSPDIHVLAWHEAPDIEDFTKLDEDISSVAVSDDGLYFAGRPGDDYASLVFIDNDGKELYRFDKGEFIKNVMLCEDRAVISDRDGLWIVDPYGKTESFMDVAEYDFDAYSYEDYITKDGSMAVIWGSKELMLLDLTEKKKLFEYETDSIIGKAAVAGDGSKIYVIQGNENMYVLDTQDGSRTEMKSDDYRTVAGNFDKACIAVSPDDRYVALCCMDGMIRVADTSSYETTAKIPLQSYLRSFVSFTDDGTHLVMQGDDYRIRIWDMNAGSFVCTMDGSGSVDHIVCDDESGLLAICQGYGLFLFETGGYGCVAYADNGMVYLKDNDSILLSNDRRTICRTYYKDYKTLKEEAHRQFPGASLSDEKKVKYNI